MPLPEKKKRNVIIYKKKMGIGCKPKTYRQLSAEYDLSVTRLQTIIKREKETYVNNRN